MCPWTVRCEEVDKGCVAVVGPSGRVSSAKFVLILVTWLKNAITDTTVMSHLRFNLRCKIRCRTPVIQAIVAGILNQTLDLGFLTLVKIAMGLVKLIVLLVKIALGLIKIHFFGQNCCAEGGFNEQCRGPNVGPHGWSRPSGEWSDFRPPNPGPQTGGPADGFNGWFGMPSYLWSNVGPNIPPPMPTNPFVNNVQLDQANPIGNFTVLWCTKPHARVFSASNPCFELPKLGDIHASDYSDPSISGFHINSDRHRVSATPTYFPVLETNLLLQRNYVTGPVCSPSVPGSLSPQNGVDVSPTNTNYRNTSSLNETRGFCA
ncbi:hypothetical protein GOBAR_DD36355 [Gossypium barbadense]|nr:hypothetical protein GOBAR_DD36355 [Gossypium barbadense]